MNVVDVLKAILTVAHGEEVTTNIAATNSKPRKVRMGFSGNAAAHGH
jgi:hypothetical protein